MAPAKNYRVQHNAVTFHLRE